MGKGAAVRVGVVGFGEIAQVHVRALVAAGATIAGVVTRRPAPEFTRYASLRDMLPHVEAVTIAVPNHLHADLCAEAVTAGTPVLVEKPVCIDEAGLARLERALDGASAPVHVGYRLRWNPRVRALRSIGRDAGRVVCDYRIGMERLAAGKAWTRSAAITGGAFFAIGVHALDFARWLAGAQGRPLRDVRASASHVDASADYPLLVEVRGRLEGGPELIARADLRGDAPFRLVVRTEAVASADGASLGGLVLDDEAEGGEEYRGLMAAFVEAVGSRTADREAIAEIVQTHRELLWARRLTRRPPDAAASPSGGCLGSSPTEPRPHP